MSKNKPHPRAWGQKGHHRDAGIIGSQAQDPISKRNAKFGWYARQKKKFLDKIESEDLEVKDMARQLLMEVYGCELPRFLHEEMTDYKPDNPKRAPHWLTSKDQVELMKDMSMLSGVVNDDWPVSKGVKEVSVMRIHQILNSPMTAPELHLKAVQVLAKLDAANIARKAATNPQKHEHVHVQLQERSADEQRARILDFLRAELEGRNLAEPRRATLGIDEDVIDVAPGEQPA